MFHTRRALLSLAVLCLALFPASFAGAAGLSVLSTLPQGEVEQLTQITVRFSETMRPLGVMEETAENSPLRLSVPGGILPAGQFRWLDPATLAYLFNAPVNGPIRIDATVPAGTTALSGAVLKKEARWSLNTEPFHMALLDADLVDAGRDTALPPTGGVMVLESNYPLEAASLNSTTRISSGGKGLRFELREAGSYAYTRGAQTRWLYEFLILDTLGQDSTVTLRIEPGTALQGGFAPAPGYTFSKRTYQGLQLLSWYPYPANRGGRDSGGGGRSMRPEENAGIVFNNPVMRPEFLSHLEISPPVNMADMLEDALDDDWSNTGQNLSFAWAPRTRYTVIVKPGLRDIYGTTLQQEQRLRFATTDYYPFFQLSPGVVMEHGQGGIVWLTALNAPSVTVRLRCLPWSSKTARQAWRDWHTTEDLPGARERTVRLDFSDRPNSVICHPLKLAELLGLEGPEALRGIIALRATVTLGNEKGKGPQTYSRFFQSTNLGLTLKTGRDSGLALVTDLETGEPRAGVRLTLYDQKDAVVWKGTSDENGLAALPGTKLDPHLLLAETETDSCVLNLGGDRLPQESSARIVDTDSDRLWAAHTVSQLPLYQPGQEVLFAVFARVFTDERTADGETTILPYPDWLAVTDEAVELTITDPRGRVVHTQNAVTNAYGTIDGSFTLAPEAALGGYTVTLKCSRFKQTAYDYQAFQVASFRPPDFKVDITAPEDQPTPPPSAPSLNATVKAVYFSGAGLADAKTAFTVRRTDSFFAPTRLRGYRTGAHDSLYRGMADERPGLAGDLAGEKSLDAEGWATFSLSGLKAEPGTPVSISLEATVTDATGLTTQGAASFLLHPASLYIGIRAPYVAPEGKDVTVELAAAAWDDAPVSSAQVRLTAERILADDEREKAWEKELFLDTPQGRPFSVRFDRGGVYELTATITDDEGRDNIARTVVYVPGRDMVWISRRGGNGLELMADKDSYVPGETAAIMVNSPFERALALVSLERKGVRSWFLRQVEGPAPVIDIPLDADDAPYVFASVTLIRGRTAPPPTESGHDEGAPQALHAALCLVVDDSPPKLTATVTSDKQDYRPGGQVTATVRVADTRQRPRKAQVTLLAVDERILRAAGEQGRYDPGITFGAELSHDVLSADTRTRLLNLGVPLLQGEAGGGGSRVLRSMAVMEDSVEMSAMAPLPSAPQPAAPGQEGENAIRENFSPLAFWLAAEETDENGVLEASFTLPDTVTSYRIVAVIADTGSDFALAETSVTATKPLQLLSALPRFLTAGDELEARILVQNMGQSAGTVTLQAAGENLTLTATTRTIRLEAGGSGSVSFPLTAGEPGTGTLRLAGHLTGTTRQETDAVQIVLPILPGMPLTTVAAAGMLDEGGGYTLPVQTPVPLDSRSSLEVVFAPSPAAGMSLVAGELIEYPWSCLEQRLSRAWLRTMRLRHGEVLGLPAAQEDLARVKETLASVPDFQGRDGGFSIWPNLRRSNPYLSAFALLAAREAEELGLSLAPHSRAAALRYLRRQFAVKEIPLEQKAVILWALAAHDDAGETAFIRQEFPRLVALAEKSTDTNPMTWGALLMVTAEMPDIRNAAALRGRIMTALEKSANVTATQLHFTSYNEHGLWMTMGSTLRDNGLALGAMARCMPEYPRLEALAHWVSQGLGEKKVLSTQEAIFGLWGLGNYLRSLGGNRPVSMRATWNDNDAESVSKSFTRLIDAPQSWVLPAPQIENAAESALTLTALEGRPYWTVRLRYASPSLPVQPENAGFTITRAWLTPGPWKMGDEVTASVTITVPATRRHVLLYAPFPAGLEPLHATRVDIADAATRYQDPWQWQESREDGMLLYAEAIQPGVYTYTYTLRAAAPGVFTLRPARVEEMYTPEVFGRTNNERVTVFAQ